MLLRVENNNKFVRGKGKVRKNIESFLISQYNMEQRSGEYIFYVPYTTIPDLEQKVDNIIREIDFEADLQNCLTELDVYCDELELQCKSNICLYKELHYKIIRRKERQGEETHVHKISKFTNCFRF